jgi:uncharacterized membrane protein YtjA (UPF0391 family)
MLAWGLTVLVVALVAAVLGFSGIATAAATIAKVTIAVGLGVAVLIAVVATLVRAWRRR